MGRRARRSACVFLALLLQAALRQAGSGFSQATQVRLPVELCPADERLLALAERVHGELAEKAPKANACEELLRGLVSEESLLACCWLAEMRKKQVPLDASSLEAVVRGLGGNGLASQAEAVLEAWSKELLAVGEAAPSHCLVVQAFARRGDLAKAQAWLDRMDAAEIPIDAPTYAAAIEALAQGGPAEPARRLLDSAMGRAVELGEPTFTAVIAAFAKESKLPEAEAVLQAMRDRDVVPGAEAWGWLLIASATSDSRLRRRQSYTSAESIFREMLEHAASTPFVLRALGRAVGAERREELCKELRVDLAGVPGRRLRKAPQKNRVSVRQKPYADGYWPASEYEEATGTAPVWLGDESMFNQELFPRWVSMAPIFKPDKDHGTRRHHRPNTPKAKEEET